MSTQDKVEPINIDESKDEKLELIKNEEPVGNQEEKMEKETEKPEEAKSPTKTKPAKPVLLKSAVFKEPYETDVVYLYQFSRTPVIPSPSAYCLKVETWLRICGIKYENVDHKMRYRSIYGQLPFIELNGEQIADSAVIINKLGEKFGKNLDEELTSEQKALAHSAASMLENHLHWVDTWWRGRYPDQMLAGYKIDPKHFSGTKLPAPLVNFVAKFTLGRKLSKKARAIGIGVQKPEEIIESGKTDLDQLHFLLGEKCFFFGSQPTLVDVVVFSNIAQFVVVDKDVAHPFRDYIHQNCQNLLKHFERIKERYYPDWEEMCKTLDMNTHLPKTSPSRE